MSFPGKKKLCWVVAAISLTSSALAQDRQKMGPEFPNLEIQVSMLRPGDVKGFATDATIKPGVQPRFRYGNAGGAHEMTWSFIERSDFGDIYKFTKVGPAQGKEREISQRQVMYTGRETIIWQDEEQRIVLKPRPAPED